VKLLTNRSGSYLTSTGIADAVLHYGLLLARSQEIDIVNVPFVDSDGATRRVQFTVGWQSDTSAISDANPDDDLSEADTIQEVLSKARALRWNHAQPFTDDEREHVVQWPSFYYDMLD